MRYNINCKSKSYLQFHLLLASIEEPAHYSKQEKAKIRRI